MIWLTTFIFMVGVLYRKIILTEWENEVGINQDS